MLYLVAHDNATGRPHAGRRLLGLGVSAALFGELLLGGLVEVRDEAVYPVSRPPTLRRIRHYSGGLRILGWCPTSHSPVAVGSGAACSWCGVPGVEEFPEPVAREAWRLIERERQLRPVRDWLEVLAHEAPIQVARRLESDGWLVAERRGTWLGRSSVRWMPDNIVDADGPRQALRRVALGVEQRPDRHLRLAAGLIEAVRLTRLVVIDVPDQASAARRLANSTRDVDGSMHHLIAETKAAADDAVIARSG